MSYLIKKTWSNGYRCGCCHASHECDDQWVDTLEEAMALIPDEPFNDHAEWGGPLSIAIFDGNNHGIQVGEGKITWPTGGERGTQYQYTRWSGFRTKPDGTVDRFEQVYHQGTLIEDPWGDVVRRVREKKHQRDLEKAQQEMAAAQAKLDALKGDS